MVLCDTVTFQLSLHARPPHRPPPPPPSLYMPPPPPSLPPVCPSSPDSPVLTTALVLCPWALLRCQTHLQYRTSHYILGNYVLKASDVVIDCFQTHLPNIFLQGWVEPPPFGSSRLRCCPISWWTTLWLNALRAQTI